MTCPSQSSRPNLSLYSLYEETQESGFSSKKSESSALLYSFRHCPYNENPSRALNTTLLKCCLSSTDAIYRRGKFMYSYKDSRGVSRLQKIPNTTIRSKIQAEQSVLDRIQRRQLKCYGHLRLLESPCKCGIEPPGFISYGVSQLSTELQKWNSDENNGDKLLDL